jgi:hypothetical protein
MASGKIKIPQVFVPLGWQIEFVYNSGEFCIDWIVGSERYRLVWNATNISYQAYTGGAWSTIWVK